MADYTRCRVYEVATARVAERLWVRARFLGRDVPQGKNPPLRHF